MDDEQWSQKKGAPKIGAVRELTGLSDVSQDELKAALDLIEATRG